MSRVRCSVGGGQRSLSGGVDSMAHAVLLRLLQPEFGFGLAALHVKHPNRDDAIYEEQWVGGMYSMRVDVR